MQRHSEITVDWTPWTIVSRLLVFGLFLVAAEGAFGEIPAEITDKAKGRFFDIYFKSEARSIIGSLEHRGLATDTEAAIAADVARAIADCIVDGLNEGESQVAYTYLVLIADLSIDEDLSGRLRDAYSRAEVEEFNNLTAELMRDCREAAYAKHQLPSN